MRDGVRDSALRADRRCGRGVVRVRIVRRHRGAGTPEAGQPSGPLGPAVGPMPPELPACRACTAPLGTRRRRGLCGRCYARPDVRAAHAPRQAQCRHDPCEPSRDAGEPVSALPHTEEYLDALAERARRRLPLFDPRDVYARAARYGADWREHADLVGQTRPGRNLFESWRQAQKRRVAHRRASGAALIS